MSDTETEGGAMRDARVLITGGTEGMGNPFSDLYFPEKVLEYEALPVHYAMGTKVALYFALGWLFTFFGQLTLFRTESAQRAAGSV